MEPILYEDGDPLLTPEEEAWLEGVGQTLHRSAGHVFMEEGEETDFVLLIRKGHVKVMSGSPKQIIAIRHGGEIIGEMSALRTRPRSASVQAADSVEVLRISARQWKTFLSLHPRAALAQLAEADRRLEQATRKIVQSELAVEQRLAKALVELMDTGLCDHTDEGVVLRFSQKDIAALTGASVDSVKKIIKTFKSREYVSVARRATVILNPSAIRKIADGDDTASAEG